MRVRVARAGAGPGGEHVAGDRRKIDRLAVRHETKAAQPGIRRRLTDEAERRGAGTVRTERHRTRERDRRARRKPMVVAGAEQVARRARREAALVERRRRLAADHDRHVVDDVDLEAAGGERDGVAVEVDRLDEIRQVEDQRVLVQARRVVERIDQGERIGAVAVEGEREHLGAVARPARIGGERLRHAIGPVDRRRQREEVDLCAVRRDPEVMRASRHRELEAGTEQRVAGPDDDVRAVRAEAHQAGERAGRGHRRARIVAVAEQVARRARRQPALVDDAEGRAGLKRDVAQIGAEVVGGADLLEQSACWCRRRRRRSPSNRCGLGVALFGVIVVDQLTAPEHLELAGAGRECLARPRTRADRSRPPSTPCTIAARSGCRPAWRPCRPSGRRSA